MFANKIEAVEYIQKIWYRSKFDVAQAEAALSFIDDTYTINHITTKIHKMTEAEQRAAAQEENHKVGRYFVKKYYITIIETLKARDGDQCRRCKKKHARYQVDHIVPLKKMGDPQSMDNLQLLCELCNKIKGER